MNSGLGVRSSEDVKKELKYVTAKTVTELKELVSKRERGEISYLFIAVRRNGDKVFAVREEVN